MRLAPLAPFFALVVAATATAIGGLAAVAAGLVCLAAVDRLMTLGRSRLRAHDRVAP